MLLALAALPASGTTATVPPRTILVLGDSVSAGYGLAIGEGWVSLLQGRLKMQGYGYRVVNASVSGETTTGGLARLPRALSVHRPQIVVLELGGNDGLRGLPLETSRANLEKMIQLSKAAGAQVVLLGMKMPPNYGPRYAQGFERTFAELAASTGCPSSRFSWTRSPSYRACCRRMACTRRPRHSPPCSIRYLICLLFLMKATTAL